MLGLPESLLVGLESGEAAPVKVSELHSHLKRTLDKERAKELYKTHKAKLVRTCAVNTQILTVVWDPNSWGGALTGGGALNESERGKFEEALAKLLTEKIEHSSSNIPSNCFIATAATGDANNPDVITLRRFRDQKLKRTAAGRFFVRAYERWAPLAAQAIRSNRPARRLSLLLLVGPSAKFATYLLRREESKLTRAKARMHRG